MILLTREATKGATIDPILAHIDPAPSPVFLTTVGNSSVEYKYIVVKPTAVPVTPTVAKLTLHHSASK